MNRPHEDPNCKCKACEEWAADLSPLAKAWEAELAGWDEMAERLNQAWAIAYQLLEKKP